MSFSVGEIILLVFWAGFLPSFHCVRRLFQGKSSEPGRKETSGRQNVEPCSSDARPRAKNANEREEASKRVVGAFYVDVAERALLAERHCCR